MNTLDTQTPNAEFFGKPVTAAPWSTARKLENGTYVNALGLESTEEHKHVSVIWQKQCVTADVFAADVNAQAAEKRDINVGIDKIKLDNNLSIQLGDHSIGFTNHGLLSLPRNKMGEGFVDYLVNSVPEYKDNDATIIDRAKSDAAYWLNYEIQHRSATRNEKIAARLGKYQNQLKDARTPSARRRLEDNIAEMERRLQTPEELLLRLRGDDNGNTVCRYVGSSKYGVLDNAHVIEMLQGAIPGGWSDALMSHAQNTGDDIWGNLLLPDYLKSMPDSDYGIGVYFKNSEIGRFQFEIMPFLFRAICLNGCIWGRQNAAVITKKHIGKLDLAEIAAIVKEKVQTALNGGHKLLDRMQDTREVKVSDHNPLIAYICDRNNLTTGMGKAWAKSIELEPGDTAFQTVQGLTRAAQQFSGDARGTMEEVAGSILAPDLDASIDQVLGFWKDLQDGANKLTAEEVEKYTLAK